MADASKSLRSADEIAALCDDFVKHVGAYLEWQKITNLTARLISPVHSADKPLKSLEHGSSSLTGERMRKVFGCVRMGRPWLPP